MQMQLSPFLSKIYMCCCCVDILFFCFVFFLCFPSPFWEGDQLVIRDDGKGKEKGVECPFSRSFLSFAFLTFSFFFFLLLFCHPFSLFVFVFLSLTPLQQTSSAPTIFQIQPAFSRVLQLFQKRWR